MASNPPRVLGSAPDRFSLLDLPNELLIEIAQSMDANDLCRLMQACCRLNNVLAPCLRACFIQNKDKILHDACTENNITIIRQAIAVGAKPAAKFLLRACARNNIEIVTILLDGGKLDVNLFGHQDTTFRAYHPNPVSPLQMAIHFCHPAIVEALFSRGAKVNNDPTHYDYLMRAVNSGDITILRSVLEHVETIPVYAGTGWSRHADPVRHAMLNRREMLLPFVERGCHLEHARFSPRTALSFAVYFNCVDTVKLLLENGCDPNYPKFPWIYSPLIECCSRRGNVEIMRALLEAGADPDEDVNLCCQGPLQIAMSRGHVEAVRLLVKWTKRTIHPICWFPERVRHPSWLDGRQECKRILDEACFDTGSNTTRECIGRGVQEVEVGDGWSRWMDGAS